MENLASQRYGLETTRRPRCPARRRLGSRRLPYRAGWRSLTPQTNLGSVYETFSAAVMWPVTTLGATTYRRPLWGATPRAHSTGEREKTAILRFFSRLMPERPSLRSVNIRTVTQGGSKKICHIKADDRCDLPRPLPFTFRPAMRGARFRRNSPRFEMKLKNPARHAYHNLSHV